MLEKPYGGTIILTMALIEPQSNLIVVELHEPNLPGT